VERPTALLTGGSAGIGAAICGRLLDAGYGVISLDRDPPAQLHPRLHAVTVDLADAEATRQVAEDCARSHPATVVIHNAGAVLERPLEEVRPLEVETLVGLHLAAPIALVQANLAPMKAARFGRIVLVATRAVLGLANRTVYAATKASMLGMSRTWALELGPHGITSNVVAPGPIADTAVFHDLVPRDSPKLPRIVESIPVKRLGQPDDVARAVMFFVDPAASFVTGQTLFVCGGTSVGSITY
jgi:NAD(P)-dependent dehydrogenase (short-subunit alcohol dehydrogenase family)